MSPELHKLYKHLADGHDHDRRELAGQLGISPAALDQRMRTLRGMGLPVSNTKGGSYRIERPVELLDAERIAEGLDREVSIEVTGAVDSTNARLGAGGRSIRHAHALIAEAQTAGRGRRGRNWRSPPGGIYLSLGWHFDRGPGGLAALSLVVGMAAATALRDMLTINAMVKWPNDLFLDGRKLGGCLVELGGAAHGPCQAVIGVGVNMHLPADIPLDQPWTSLGEHCPNVVRNRLLTCLINELARHLREFDAAGFESFATRWHRLDALKDRRLRIIADNGETLAGHGQGVDAEGRLLVRTQHRLQSFHAGEVSVRG